MSLLKRAREGYLMIDNRESPAQAAAGLAQAQLPLSASRGLFEAPTYTCSHCTKVVVLNPLRTRDRSYCSRCDSHICDQCGAILAASGVCQTFSEVMDLVASGREEQLVNPHFRTGLVADPGASA